MSYADTALLLPMNGADAGTSFPDLSRHNRTVTANGNAQTSTAQSQFYGSSGLFDGSGDYLSLPADDANWRFNTAGFCVELWVRLAAVDQLEYLIAHKSGLDSGWILVTTAAGDLQFLHWNTGSGLYLTLLVTHGMSAGVWYHIAADWDGTTLRLFVDGTSLGSTTTLTGTIQHAAAGTALLIGRDVANAGTRDFTGHMQDVRITRSSRYTANFTPPAKLMAPVAGTITDDTGTAVERRIWVVPRESAPGRIFTGLSSAVDGTYSIDAPNVECNRIVLDDDAGTQYNDLIDRVAVAV